MSKSKIVGFEFNDHRAYESTNKQTGEVTTKYLDSVTLYITVPVGSDDKNVYRRGVTTKEYTVQSKNLEAVFNCRISEPVKFLDGCLDRECIPQTSARSFRRDGNEVFMGEELIACYFIDELIAGAKPEK